MDPEMQLPSLKALSRCSSYEEMVPGTHVPLKNWKREVNQRAMSFICGLEG
jgi:hypothetical protein